MPTPRYTKTVDALRLGHTAESAIEYRLRIFEPARGDDPLVVICTCAQPLEIAFVAGLASELLAEVAHPGPWTWVQQQSSPRARRTLPRDERLRLLVLVRDGGGPPSPYRRTWTPTNRQWVEQLLAQALDPPAGRGVSPQRHTWRGR